ncbi:phospholipid scramblase 1-like [Rhinophrynus dorsalis]
MTSTEFTPSGFKSPDEGPPSYNTIAPYAPPDMYPPTAPVMDSTPIKGVPPGLQYLIQINQLSVRERFAVNQGWSRLFDVLTPSGQRVFQAQQTVQCCGPIYNVSIKDGNGIEVMGLNENCRCSCTRQMEVYGSDGANLGFVPMHWNSFVTHLSVQNSSRQTLLMIIGPSFQTNIFGNVSFEIKSNDEQHVIGMIRNTNEEFSVSFPLDLEVTVKALLLAACLYLDSLIYQRRRQLLNRRNSN